MYNRLIPFVVAILVLASTLRADLPGPTTVTCPEGMAPTVDGVIADVEWDDALVLRKANDAWPHDSQRQAADIRYDADDLSCELRIKHDGEYLYILAIIRDDVWYGLDVPAWKPDRGPGAKRAAPFWDSPDDTEDWGFWGDCLEIALSADMSPDYKSFPITGPFDAKKPAAGWKIQGNVSYDRLMTGALPASWVKDGHLQWKAGRSKDGRTFIHEWAIALDPCLMRRRNLPYEPGLSVPLGFQVILVDADAKDAAGKAFPPLRNQAVWPYHGKGPKKARENWAKLYLEFKPKIDKGIEQTEAVIKQDVTKDPARWIATGIERITHIQQGDLAKHYPSYRPATMMSHGVHLVPDGEVELSAKIGPGGAIGVHGEKSLVNFTGSWVSDGFPSLALTRSGRFIVKPEAKIDLVMADSLFTRQLWVWGDGTGTVELDRGFVADRTDGGTVPDAFGTIRLAGVNFITHDSKSLPSNGRPDGRGGIYQNGHIVFEGNTPSTWSVRTAPQTYAAQIDFALDGTIDCQQPLTHAGQLRQCFGFTSTGAFRTTRENVTVTKTGPAMLSLDGQQGWMPGSRLVVKEGTLRIQTDPAAVSVLRATTGEEYGPNLTIIVEQGASLLLAADHVQVASIRVAPGGRVWQLPGCTVDARGGVHVADGGKWIKGVQREPVVLDDAAKRRVLFLLADGFNATEFYRAALPLMALGYDVDVAASTTSRPVFYSGSLKPDRKGRDWQPNIRLKDVKTDRYLGLFIPGGFSPGALSKMPLATRISADFMMTNRPVGAVCHGPRLLAHAGLIGDRTTTALLKVANEMPDAWRSGEFGAWMDRGAVIDGNLVTGQSYGAMEDVTTAYIDVLAEAGGIPALDRTVNLAVVCPDVKSRHGRWGLVDAPQLLGVPTRRVTSLKELRASNAGLVVVLPGTKAKAMRDDPEFKEAVGHAPIVILEPQTHWSKYLSPVIDAVRQHGKPKPAKSPTAPATAALAIAPGFDDGVAATMKAVLTAAGHDVVIVSEETGWVRGQYGTRLEATQTYDAAHLTKDAIIVAPGGVWPTEVEGARQAVPAPWLAGQGARDQARVSWLIDRWNAGAVVHVIGMDAIRLSKDKRITDCHVAVPPDATTSLWRTGVKRASEPVHETAPRLFSTAGAAAVPELIKKLMVTDAKGEAKASP